MTNTGEDSKMKKPIITLKSVKLHVTLSEETPAYTAKIYVDGKFFCDVDNHGQGGPDSHSVNYKEVGELDKRIADTYPKTKYDWSDEEFPETLECICHTLVWKHNDMRSFKSSLSRKWMYMKGGTEGVFQVKKRAGDTPEFLKEKFGANTIFNTFKNKDVAFDLYIANVQTR